MTVYNGSLGYESLVCYYCNLDVKSEEMITCCNIYEGEMRSELREAKDKLHRRNMQIKELKEKLSVKEFYCKDRDEVILKLKHELDDINR